MSDNPARTVTVRKTLLETLAFAHGYALAETTLKSQIDALVRPPVSDDEWKVALHWMQLQQLITQVESDLDETLVQYAITERGRVKLAAL